MMMFDDNTSSGQILHLRWIPLKMMDARLNDLRDLINLIRLRINGIAPALSLIESQGRSINIHSAPWSHQTSALPAG